MGTIFGPAGNSKEFKKEKNLSLLKYLKSYNLKAYEFQCGMGIKISQEKAEEFFKNMEGITISIHAPYYISLSSVEEEKRKNSVQYILKTAKIAKAMRAKRMVIHSGSCRKISRKEALKLAKKTLKEALESLKENELDEIFLCPETMGKTNQLGNLEEVLELCKISEKLIPCLDFGHLNARSFGKIKGSEEYLKILNMVENELGYERLKSFHSHFSKVEFTVPGGEKKHLTFEDLIYGPEFEPLAELVVKKNLSPIFICESAGTQAKDAKLMQDTYEKIRNST